MKILVVGDWHSRIHEEPVYNAFLKLGHDVKRFSWNQYFEEKNSFLFLSPAIRFIKKLQNKVIVGPIINKINKDLYDSMKEYKPDLIFIYRGTHIALETLHKMKEASPHTILIGYNNDDPFSKAHPFWLWRQFVRSLPGYDLVFAYRHHNIDDFLKHGAKHSALLRSWYVPEFNHPVTLTRDKIDNYKCDVVFIGHYENDGRLQYLEGIVKNGIDLKIFGPSENWNPVLSNSKYLKHLIPVRSVWGEEYNMALCSSKIALCFFSKLNRDTYTRRCFEIPATRTMLLSEYSADLASIFKPGIEADYFESDNEMLIKIKYYLENDSLRTSVATAGYNCVLNQGHDVMSRMKMVIEVAKQKLDIANV